MKLFFVLFIYQPCHITSFQTRLGNGISSFHSFTRSSRVGAALLGEFMDALKPTTNKNVYDAVLTTTVETFFDALNNNRIDDAMTLVTDDVEFEDTDFPSAFGGKAKLERIIRLRSEARPDQIVIENIASETDSQKVGLQFYIQQVPEGKQRKGVGYFELDKASGLMKKGILFKESNKSGEQGLTILSVASKVIEAANLGGEENAISGSNSKDLVDPDDTRKKFKTPSFLSGVLPSTTTSKLTLPEQYFEAWNERDMQKACSLFAETIEYDDTAFASPFVGKQALERHLNVCAKVFPSTFSFVVDEKVDGRNVILVRWHVNSKGEQMPFTRGCSFYEIEDGKISRGLDIVEPAVFKTGGLDLAAQSVKSKITSEPYRLVPLAVWIAYVYVVFFSDWFFGLPVTALEQRTWEEVRDLSLNFFLVSPILGLPFAPVVHPMLEGVFNLLLSWAALFAGFLCDDRRDKPNLLPMLPMVAGMQFLTSAFLLPYLITRSTENSERVFRQDLPQVAQLAESRLLGVAMSAVGTGSIVWALLARMEFGSLNERWVSFLDLLSIDRVGSSFLVDLVIFSLFQGWLVDDDLKRRGMTPDSTVAKVAKYVPFMGLAAYLVFRSPLAEKEDTI